MTIVPGRVWVGSFTCYAPLTQEQYAEDAPHLQSFLDALPKTVTLRDASVWVNGREYVWERVDVTAFGGSDVSSDT